MLSGLLTFCLRWREKVGLPHHESALAEMGKEEMELQSLLFLPSKSASAIYRVYYQLLPTGKQEKGVGVGGKVISVCLAVVMSGIRAGLLIPQCLRREGGGR